MYDQCNLCMLAQQILAKTRNSPNSPNIIAPQNLLIYSTCAMMEHKVPNFYFLPIHDMFFVAINELRASALQI